MRRLILLLIALILAACTAKPAPDAGLRYSLECFVGAGTYGCLRVDTRDGDVRLVPMEDLRKSDGATLTSEGVPGLYEVDCAKSEQVRLCVRLNRRTGNLLLLDITELPETSAIVDR